MSPTEYVKNVLITEARDFSPVQSRLMEIKNIRLLHACAGISSELAEIIDIQENCNGETPIDRVNLMEELGDILWYVGIASDALNATSDVAGENFIEGVFHTYDEDLVNEIRNFCLTVGAISGELVDKAVKKSIFYGKKVDDQDLIDYLRWIHQNVKYLLENAGYTLETARVRNIEKLRARYGEKFTEAAANERNLEVERAVLEKTAD